MSQPSKPPTSGSVLSTPRSAALPTNSNPVPLRPSTRFKWPFPSSTLSDSMHQPITKMPSTPTESPTHAQAKSRPRTRSIQKALQKPKRRRSAPPPTVTSIFTPSHLPTSASALWTWPVFSWHLGFPTSFDEALAAGNAFLPPLPNPLPQRPTHYRLRWLAQDAAAHLATPPLPNPLPTLPLLAARQQPACARQMPIIGPSRPDNVRRPDEKSKLERKGEIVPSLHRPGLGPHPHPDPTICALDAPFARAVAKQTGQLSSPSNPSLPGPSHQSLKTYSRLLTYQPIHMPPTVQYPSPSPSPASTLPSVNSPSVPMPLVAQRPKPQTESPSNNHATPSPQQDPVPSNNSVEETRAPQLRNPGNKSTQMLFQFVSPNEPRVMGTLTYEIPVPPDPPASAARPVTKHPDAKLPAKPIEKPPPMVVGDVELEYRNADKPFLEDFDDSDKTDQLAPHILSLSAKLSAIISQRPHPNRPLTAIRDDITRNQYYTNLLEEQKSIEQRLKILKTERHAAKAPNKVKILPEKPIIPVQKRKPPANRRSSSRARQGPATVPRPSSRRRRVSRPTRKILEEMDDDLLILPKDKFASDQFRTPAVPSNHPLIGSNPDLLKTTSSTAQACAGEEPMEVVPVESAEVSRGESGDLPIGQAPTQSVDAKSPESVAKTVPGGSPSPEADGLSSGDNLLPMRSAADGQEDLLPTSNTSADNKQMSKAAQAFVKRAIATDNVSVATIPVGQKQNGRAVLEVRQGNCKGRGQSGTGSKSEAVQSPVGIFPGENEEREELSRVPSPVSPIQTATGRSFSNRAGVKLDVKKGDAEGISLMLRLKLQPGAEEKTASEGGKSP